MVCDLHWVMVICVYHLFVVNGYFNFYYIKISITMTLNITKWEMGNGVNLPTFHYGNFHFFFFYILILRVKYHWVDVYMCT